MERNTQSPTWACRAGFCLFPFTGAGLRVNTRLGSSDSVSSLDHCAGWPWESMLSRLLYTGQDRRAVSPRPGNG